MKFDTGLWDRLFGEKTVVEFPGPGGIRKFQVTVKWLEKMQREGKIAPVAEDLITVHILDPLHGYHATTWTVGKDIPREDVDAFIDSSTQSIYVLRGYRDGVPDTRILRKDLWDQAKKLWDSV